MQVSQVLNQLKIGNIVYDLAAKYDSNNENIKDTYFRKDSKGKFGVRATCKVCEKELRKKACKKQDSEL